MRTICLDFDGVIHTSIEPFGREDKIPGTPVEGIKDFIVNLRENFAVVILSSRARSIAGKNAIIAWLAKNDIQVDFITAQKVPAHVYIDDRAIQFRGTVQGLMEQIDMFQTWEDDKEQQSHDVKNEGLELDVLSTPDMVTTPDIGT